jgi:hypothetical protein
VFSGLIMLGMAGNLTSTGDSGPNPGGSELTDPHDVTKVEQHFQGD